MVNHLDLFSGIGGFRLALDLAGIPVAHTYFSEIDLYAVHIYQKNFPSAVGLGDIRSISGKELRRLRPGTWLVTGGFPCQDISSAGLRRGLAGERSGLWFEMHRIIKELRPELVLAENVGALKYRGLREVLHSLDVIGYDAEWHTLSAQDVGAIHQRKRLWITSYPRNADRDELRSALQLHPVERTMGDVQQHDGPSRSLITRTDWPSIEAAGTFRGEPLVRRRTDGLSFWLDRIRACGNAIVPQCAEKVLKELEGEAVGPT